MAKFVTALALIIISSKVLASSTGNTKIIQTMMSSDYGQILFVKVSHPPSRASGHCHTSTSWDYVMSTGSELGKQILSQILVAYGSQRDVVISGDNSCNVRSSTETLTRVELL